MNLDGKDIYAFHPPWKDQVIDFRECRRIFFNDHPDADRMELPHQDDLPPALDLDDHRAVLARTDPTVVRWRNYFNGKYGEDLGSTFFLLFVTELFEGRQRRKQDAEAAKLAGIKDPELFDLFREIDGMDRPKRVRLQWLLVSLMRRVNKMRIPSLNP